ncbi:MAG: MFS transporter, partial [Bdellovibrionales bacterium]|nr:MFS transporter [Bdellovibrionales bacterium]
MFILAPLKRRSIALLWGGQVLSNVGDEIYKVAMVWMAADLIGLKAGYLTAGLACLVFIFSLIGGIWADNWDHRLTMFWVDVLRVFALLTIPLASYLGHLNLFVLVIATGVVASLTAFFDPALRSIIPEVADEPELLQATNGLMEMSGRLARVVGPGLIGVAKAALPMVHFFTLNAVTFSLSALSLMGFRTHAAGRVAPGAGGPKLSMRDSVLGGIRLVWAHDLMRFVMVCASIINALWMLVFPLAIGLLLHERMPEDVRVLARVISAYGVGNVL